MSPSRYEYPFDPELENNTASTIFQVARIGGTRVLDVGSGPGIVAGALVHLADKDATCLDLEDDHLEEATRRGVQHAVQADLTSRDWAAALDGRSFDVIILADVLEHLTAPQDVLRVIRERALLDRGGFLVVSIPNASHVSIVAALAGGDFPYRPTGLLDETHLRFFTLRSMRRLLESTGWTITQVHRTVKRLDQSELADAASVAPADIVHLLEKSHDEADTYQYVLKVEPLQARRSTVHQDDVELLRRRLRQATLARSRAEDRLAEVDAELKELREQLSDIHRSATWRTGRIFIAGPARLRQRWRR